MRKNKRKNIVMLLLVLLLAVSVGYALIATTLKINGNATITKQTWNVYWGVPTVTEGSVSTTAPTRGADSGDPANTKLTWNVTLNMPGDFYEFQVDAVNAGTIDAMITGITPTVSPALPTNPEYIKYSVTYANGATPALNHLLPKAVNNTPTTQRYKVRVYYDEAAATASTINNMTADTTYTFNLELTYGQATDEAIDLSPPTVPSCPDCVYAIYTTPIPYDPDAYDPPALTNYTDDYRTLLDINNQRSDSFLGHTLNMSGKITQSYSCRVYNMNTANETVLCLKPGTDSGVYDLNLANLNATSICNDYNCSTDNGKIEIWDAGYNTMYQDYDSASVISYGGSFYPICVVDNSSYCYLN